MKPEHKIWWEELADQYEEWAENPPMYDGEEEYTCCALNWKDWGFASGTISRIRTNASATNAMRLIWRDQYGNTKYPANNRYDSDRDSKRFDFCWHMAETIREALEGKQDGS